MNRTQTLDMEIQRCETEFHALNAEKLPYIEISAVATAIVEFLSCKGCRIDPDFTQEERRGPEEHWNEKAYTYRQTRMELNNATPIEVTDLTFELGAHIERSLSTAVTEQTIKPLGLSIQSWHEHTPRVVILLAETKPPNHYTVILLGLKRDSATTLYDQCKRMSLSAKETVELFHFFYERFVNIMSNGIDHPTLITDGAEDQQKVNFCEAIINDKSTTLTTMDETNTTQNICFQRCKTLTFETYKNLFKPYTRYLPANEKFSVTAGEETIWINNHPFFPNRKVYVTKEKKSSHFTLKYTQGTNEQSPGAIHIVNCLSKYILFYCICAFMEQQGENSSVCKKLRSRYGMPLFSSYNPTTNGGINTYNIPENTPSP